jgi:hypothetical protein
LTGRIRSLSKRPKLRKRWNLEKSKKWLKKQIVNYRKWKISYKEKAQLWLLREYRLNTKAW